MVGQLYQVSYLGATYYAVPVYYPGSTVFQSWYLIAYLNGTLYPYTIVPGNAVTILYNPYLGGAPAPGSPTPGTPAPSPGTPSPSPGSPAPTPVGTPVVSVIVSSTAPGSPTDGQIWYNSGSTTQNGIPAGQYGRWNAGTSSWTLLGATTPAGVSGVVAVNGQSGAVTLAGANGVTVSQASGVITIAGSGGSGGNSGTPATTPIVSTTAPGSPSDGQIWYNSSNGTVAGVPSGNYARWNAGTSSWTVLGTTAPANVGGVVAINGLTGALNLVAGANVTLTPSGNSITITAAGGGGGSTPTPIPVASLAAGANNTWLNTNNAGQVGWTPLVVPNVDRNPGFVSALGNVISTTLSVVQQFICPSERVDALSSFNTTLGQFVVPAGFGGVWMIGSLIQIVNFGGSPISVGATVNSTSYLPADIIASGNYIVSGFRPYILLPGDIVRWYTYTDGTLQLASTSMVYGFLSFPL